jgi:hypothetical protein
MSGAKLRDRFQNVVVSPELTTALLRGESFPLHRTKLPLTVPDKILGMNASSLSHAIGISPLAPSPSASIWLLLVFTKRRLGQVYLSIKSAGS